MKQKLITIGLAIAGLVAVYLIGTGISGVLYSSGNTAPPDNYNLDADGQRTDGENPEDEGTDGLETEPAKPAMTEEEIYALLETMRLPNVESAITSDDESADQTGEIPVKFEELWEINDDVYAWISIPGAGVEYPILQHPSDNGYYLHHNIDGSYGYPACIYTEDLNSKDFTDNNTVIYGHNMRNGTMFGALHQFESKDFFEENTEVTIYLPEQELHYTIFAAYLYDDRHLLYSFDFDDLDIYADYLQTIYNIRDMNANINRDVTVTNEDKIITLATCTNADPNKRYLVQAVLQEE